MNILPPIFLRHPCGKVHPCPGERFRMSLEFTCTGERPFDVFIEGVVRRNCSSCRMKVRHPTPDLNRCIGLRSVTATWVVIEIRKPRTREQFEIIVIQKSLRVCFCDLMPRPTIAVFLFCTRIPAFKLTKLDTNQF